MKLIKQEKRIDKDNKHSAAQLQSMLRKQDNSRQGSWNEGKWRAFRNGVGPRQIAAVPPITPNNHPSTWAAKKQNKFNKLNLFLFLLLGWWIGLLVKRMKMIL